MAPTRNSSSIGGVQGVVVLGVDGCDRRYRRRAAVPAAPRRAAPRPARRGRPPAAFSRATLVDLGPAAGLQEERARARLAHRPGHETVRRVVVEDLSGHVGDPTLSGSGRPGPRPSPAEPPTTASEDAGRRRRRLRGGGTRAARSPPVSFTRRANGRNGVYRITDTEHGSTTIRWKASKCIPRASASTDLITSPWETTTQTAESPCAVATAVSCSRTASTARTCMASIDSPCSPGNVTAEGWAWTTRHSGSLESSLRERPVQSP